MSLSWSYDLKNRTYFGRADSGENVCVLVEGGEYVLLHSPGNGIGVKRSKDLKQWRDVDGLITPGQKQWRWAENNFPQACLDSRTGEKSYIYGILEKTGHGMEFY